MNNYYVLLKLEPTASEVEVKKALLRELRLWTNKTNATDLLRQQEAQRQIKLLDEADAILLDPGKRAEYDRQLGSQSAAASPTAEPDLSGIDNPVEEVRRLLGEGRIADAVYLAQRATEAYPRNSDVWWVLGLADSEFGEPVKAIDALKRAIAIRPNQPLYYFDLGNIYELSEQWAEALQCYERAYGIDPSVLMYRAGSGIVLVKMGRYAEGTEVLEQCVQQEPENRTYVWFLASAYADSAHLGWTLIEEGHPLLEPGYYATSLEQVQVAQEAVAKALSFEVDEPELTAHLAFVKRDIDRMTEREFVGHWGAGGILAGIGVWSVFEGNFGGIVFALIAALYLAGSFVPRYIKNRQLVQGKSFDEFGWISRTFFPVGGGGVGYNSDWPTIIFAGIRLFAGLFLTVAAICFFAFYNLYRYHGDAIRRYLTSSQNKERLSAMMTKLQAATKQTAGAASGTLANLIPNQNGAANAVPPMGTVS